MKINWLLGSVLVTALGLGVVSGCSTDARDSAKEQTGEVELKLVTRGASGTLYRLRDAIIIVQGPSSTLFIDTEADPNADVFRATVPAGSYTYFLQEGWRLESEGVDAGASDVPAHLASPNPGAFDVFENNVTGVPLRFQVGGEVVGDGAFELAIEVEELAPEPGYCSADSQCADGQTCCIAGFLGTCVELQDGAACPLPDLTVSEEMAASSWGLQVQTFDASSCALAEGCVDAPGTRRLLSFSTETDNVGDVDMVLGDPTNTPGFEFSECHGHFHFEGYAQYELLDVEGNVAATGHKQAFCLMDVTPASPDAPPSGRYHCGFQGVQRGWGDVYGAGLDCQWVDVTEVPPGDYVLRITINPERTLQESDYDNNTAEIPVTITEPGSENPTDPCHGDAAGTARECGWQFAEGFEEVSCTPGEELVVGCGCPLGNGTCAGDPMIRICDGTDACTAFESIAGSDDACGLCSRTTMLCPASGVYSVLVASFRDSEPFTCEPAAIPVP